MIGSYFESAHSRDEFYEGIACVVMKVRQVAFITLFRIFLNDPENKGYISKENIGSRLRSVQIVLLIIFAVKCRKELCRGVENYKVLFVHYIDKWLTWLL